MHWTSKANKIFWTNVFVLKIISSNTNNNNDNNNNNNNNNNNSVIYFTYCFIRKLIKNFLMF